MIIPWPFFANSWAKEAEVKAWVLESYAIEEVALGIILYHLSLLLQALVLLGKLLTLPSQVVPLPLKEFLKVIQLTPSPLKSDLQLIDFGRRLFHI
ncbi:hypothetical protein ACOSQ2_022448 [Xanthoceras sorbifolium]